MKKFLIFGVNVLVVLAVFFVGFLYGKQSIPANTLVFDVENKEADKPEDVDFGIFWEAWRKVNEVYVTPDELDASDRVYGAIKGMVEGIDDPYTTFFTPDESQEFRESISGKFEGIGAEIGLRDQGLTIIAPLRNSPAERSGLKAGDNVVLIDDVSALNMTLEEAVSNIRGEKGTKVVLTVVREGSAESIDIPIIRDTINVPSLEYTVLDNNIGHLEVSNFNDQLLREFRTVARNILTSDVKGLIIDVRNNPGGRLDVAIDFTGWFVDEGDTVVIERGRQETDEIIHTADGPSKLREIPVVVLINEGSASASEILAGALRDLRNIELIGDKTFGKGSVQAYLPLPDQSSIKITTALWFTPVGDSINDEGLEPTIAVEQIDDEEEDPDDVDEQLEEAKNVLSKQF